MISVTLNHCFCDAAGAPCGGGGGQQWLAMAVAWLARIGGLPVLLPVHWITWFIMSNMDEHWSISLFCHLCIFFKCHSNNGHNIAKERQASLSMMLMVNNSGTPSARIETKVVLDLDELSIWHFQWRDVCPLCLNPLRSLFVLCGTWNQDEGWMIN